MKVTPIEEYEGWLWKREDLFTVEGVSEINGSKTRFLKNTLEKHLPEKYSDIIICAETNSHSFHTLSRLAQHYDKNLINIRPREKWASFVNKTNELFIWQAKEDSKKYEYGGIIATCSNLPNYIENLIVSCGSGHTLYGILKGLHRYGFNKNLRVFAIGNKPFWELGISKDIGAFISYSGINLVYLNRCQDNEVREGHKYQPSLSLDVEHELQTYRYVKEKLSNIIQGQKTLFWVTGNYNFLHAFE